MATKEGVLKVILSSLAISLLRLLRSPLALRAKQCTALSPAGHALISSCPRLLQAPYQPKKLAEFSVSDGAPDEWKGDLLAVGVTADAISTEGDSKSISDESLKDLDGKLGGILSEIVATCDFAGKLVRVRSLSSAANVHVNAHAGVRPPARVCAAGPAYLTTCACDLAVLVRRYQGAQTQHNKPGLGRCHDPHAHHARAGLFGCASLWR